MKRLWEKEIKYFLLRKGSVLQEEPPVTNKVLLSGSFNPLHEGHVSLLETCVKFFIHKRNGGYFSLPIVNCDKGTIALDEAIVR